MDEAAEQFTQSQSQRDAQPEQEEEDDDGPLSQNSQPDELLQEIRAYKQKGCKCKHTCMNSFSVGEVYKHVLDMRTLEKNEKDMYIMGKLNTKSLSSQTRSGDRKRLRYTYCVQDKEVCLKTFLLLHDLGEKELKNIRAHVQKNGIQPRVHGNTG